MALRLSPKWIQNFCKLDASIEDLSDMLSQTGLETEIIDDLYLDPKLVVGEILSIEKHPDAEKLNICQVNIGKKVVTIVCGCKTVTNAKLVIVAPPGSKLPGIEIGKAVLRGIESEGMICSLNELGLAENTLGIYHIHESVAAGTSVVDWLEHDQQLLEIDITPNRGDCLSVYGIARDLSASQNKPLISYPKGQDLAKIEGSQLFEVNSGSVPAYAAMQMTINPKRQTPLYMLNRLRQAGMGSNHLVVDILNYIMLEIGQPMHGFNQDALSLPLVMTDKIETPCLLLDKELYNTKPWDLLVCDQKEPQALAGIMGGYKSRMQEDTVNVQLESAIFAPECIAKSLRRCHLNTDASYRYERSVAVDLNEIALSYAAELLVEYADAKIINKQCYQVLPKQTEIRLDAKFANEYLGIELDEKDMKAMLGRLGMEIKDSSVTIPYYRHDIKEFVDLVEEIARLYGYNNIPLSEMTDILEPKVIHQDKHHMTKLAMTHFGYHEVVQFSFISKTLLDTFKVDVDAIEIHNPIHAEYGHMRTHLWQSLILAAQYNYQRQHQNIKLFEVGSVFHLKGKKIEEPKHIAALAMGKIDSGYLNSDKVVDYYYMQSIVLNILNEYGHPNVSFVKSKSEALHPNQSADIILNGKGIGSVGMLHPKVALELGLFEVGLLDLNLELLNNSGIEKVIRPSKYPAVTRDITLSVKQDVSVQSLEIKVKDIPYMVSMQLIDIYMQDDSSKNITWTIKFQSYKETLSDKTILESMKLILNQMNKE